MFTVYIDDSGTDNHERTRVMSGACCVSSVTLWKKFERKWNEIREKEGFEHFHMTEFAGCRPRKWCRDCVSGKKDEADHPWREWSSKKRSRVLRSLAETVNKYSEFGFGIALTKKDYDQFVVKSELSELASDILGEFPYTFTIQSIAGRLSEWRKERNLKHPMKYVFDGDGSENLKQKHEIVRLFLGSASPDWLNREFNDGITPTGVAWESRKQTVQLLSADMLAWACAKARASQLFTNGKRSKEANIVLWEFKRGKKLVIASYNTEQVRTWAAKEIAFRHSVRDKK